MRKPDVEFRNTVLAMGGERDIDAIVDIEPFGVMVELFGMERCARHETEGGVEILELEAFGNRLASVDLLPAIQLSASFSSLSVSRLRAIVFRLCCGS